MHPNDFDYVRFAEFRAQREEQVRDFLAGNGPEVLVQERAWVPGLQCYTTARTPQESLEIQLTSFTAQLDLASPYLPYLEPWFGVGVFANAFGCPYVWIDGKSPQTHYSVFSAEQADALGEPDRNCEAMRLVMDGIRYFQDATGGRLPISITDTQSPFDSASLIWESSSFFTSMSESPESVHRILSRLADLVIEFSQEQATALGATWARPGHIMMSAPGSTGIALSDDNIVMVSGRTYTKFAIPYNERIAAAFGGLAIHSCGCYETQIAALAKTKGLMLVDGAFSPILDPNPNLKVERFVEALTDTGIILQPRMHQGWEEILPRLIRPGMRVAPVLPGPEAGQPRTANLDKVERMVEAALALA